MAIILGSIAAAGAGLGLAKSATDKKKQKDSDKMALINTILANKKPQPKNNTLVYVLVGAGVLVLIVGIVVLSKSPKVPVKSVV